MLPGCLASLRGAVDEIIVVDTGSADGSAELAARAGCTVSRLRWPGSFAEARNVALAQATGQWILSIDADERLDSPARLRRLVRAAPPGVGGFSVEQHNLLRVLDTGQRDVHPVDVVRVFRRHPRIRFEGAIHERIDGAVRSAGFAVRTSSVALRHLTAELPEGYVARKQARYLRMLDRALREDPSDAWARFQRGKAKLGLGRGKAALADLRAAEASRRAEPALRAMALNYRGVYAYEHGAPEEALDCAARGLALFPSQSFAWFVRAEAHFQRGEWQEALRAFSRMRVTGTRVPPREPMSGDLCLTPEQRAYHRGRCLLAMGRADAAAREFERGLVHAPEGTSCRFGLAHVARLRGARGTARRLLREAVRLDPGWTSAAQLLARWSAEGQRR